MVSRTAIGLPLEGWLNVGSQKRNVRRTVNLLSPWRAPARAMAASVAARVISLMM